MVVGHRKNEDAILFAEILKSMQNSFRVARIDIGTDDQWEMLIVALNLFAIQDKDFLVSKFRKDSKRKVESVGHDDQIKMFSALCAFGYLDDSRMTVFWTELICYRKKVTDLIYMDTFFRP